MTQVLDSRTAALKLERLAKLGAQNAEKKFVQRNLRAHVEAEKFNVASIVRVLGWPW